MLKAHSFQLIWKDISVAPKSIVGPRLCAGTNAEVGHGRPRWAFSWAHSGWGSCRHIHVHPASRQPWDVCYRAFVRLWSLVPVPEENEHVCMMALNPPPPPCCLIRPHEHSSDQETRVVIFSSYSRDFPGSLVVKTLHFHHREAQVWSLVRELRSHIPCGQNVKKKKQTSIHNPF